MCIYYSRSDSSMLCETYDLKLLIYKKKLGNILRSENKSCECGVREGTYVFSIQ